MHDASPSRASLPRQAALDLWEIIRRCFERVLADASEILREHLRHDGFAARGEVVTAAGASCEATTGRSAIRLECPFDCAPADVDEPHLRAVFGAHTPLVRVYVWRLRGTTRRLDALFGADPSTRRWACEHPPSLGPCSLDDREALEDFIWMLVSDPP